MSSTYVSQIVSLLPKYLVPLEKLNSTAYMASDDHLSSMRQLLGVSSNRADANEPLPPEIVGEFVRAQGAIARLLIQDDALLNTAEVSGSRDDVIKKYHGLFSGQSITLSRIHIAETQIEVLENSFSRELNDDPERYFNELDHSSIRKILWFLNNSLKISGNTLGILNCALYHQFFEKTKNKTNSPLESLITNLDNEITDTSWIHAGQAIADTNTFLWLEHKLANGRLTQEQEKTEIESVKSWIIDSRQRMNEIYEPVYNDCPVLDLHTSLADFQSETNIYDEKTYVLLRLAQVCLLLSKYNYYELAEKASVTNMQVINAHRINLHYCALAQILLQEAQKRYPLYSTKKLEKNS